MPYSTGYAAPDRALKVCILGGGSFGTAVACVAAAGIKLNSERFYPTLRWWVRRQELCDEINTKRANSQYWSASIPDSITSSTDIAEVAADADICIVALPSDFLEPVLEHLKVLAPSCVIVSLIKSLKISDGKVVPHVRYLSDALPGHPVAALMGPNLYKEMAEGGFAEATIGMSDPNSAEVLTKLFTTPLFQVKCISDVEAVDLCGCMKNTFTLSCGFAVGLGWGRNTTAAIIRRGLLEIAAFLKDFLPAGRPGALDPQAVILEACGIGDLILSCTAGRGQTLASEFVKQGGERSWEDLERETMGGMKIPDWHNVQEVHGLLSALDQLSAYPLLAQTHAIAFGKAAPASILDGLRSDPVTAPAFEAPAYDFSGKTAFVTGAGGGIGQAISRHLARCGARVWAVDRNEAALRAFEVEVPACSALPCDLSNVEAVHAAVAKAGAVDFLVNAAGVAFFQKFGEQTPEIWDVTMDVNARATWMLIHELGKGMAERKFGSVVNISSQSSTVAVSDKHMAYSTSKAAVDQITRLAAYALAKDNVRVNAVNPTVVRTELAIKAHGEEGLKAMAAKVPLGKICETDDVANVVLFLLSDRAGMVTGVTLPVDGGFVCARV